MRFRGNWGYRTDSGTTGLVQLGHRWYWPEIGRFLQQDPIGDGMNWYAYVENNPVVWVDPTGLIKYYELPKWYREGVGAIGDVVDDVLLGGATKNFGDTAGRHDAGCASDWELVKAGVNWGGRLLWATAQVYVPGRVGARVAWRATRSGGLVTRWGPSGRWVITGGRTKLNYWLSGAKELEWKNPGLYPFEGGQTWAAPAGSLRYPEGWEWIKGLWGQRIVR